MELGVEKRRGIFDNFTLKVVAIITMIIDHTGYIFFPQAPVFRAIGRIAFPIFCFLLVEGFFHTRSHINYLTRLIIFALLSEIPFDIALHQNLFNWQYQNVFFTLALGLLAIFCLEEMNSRPYFGAFLIIIFALAYYSHCDYGVGGVLLICMFYLTKNNLPGTWILCALILYIFFGAFELYGVIAMVPISLYNGKRGPSVKMLFYWIYPIHLLILYAVTYMF